MRKNLFCRTTRGLEFSRNETPKNTNSGKSVVYNCSSKEVQLRPQRNNTDKRLCKDTSLEVSESDTEDQRNESCEESSESADRCKYCRKPVTPPDSEYDSTDDNPAYKKWSCRRQIRMDSSYRYPKESYSYFDVDSPARPMNYPNPCETSWRLASNEKLPPVRHQYFEARKCFTDYAKKCPNGFPRNRGVSSGEIIPRYFGNTKSDSRRTAPVPYTNSETMSYNYKCACNLHSHPVERLEFYPKIFSDRTVPVQNQDGRSHNAKHYVDGTEFSSLVPRQKISQANPFHRNIMERGPRTAYRDSYRNLLSGDSFASRRSESESDYQIKDCHCYGSNSRLPYEQTHLEPLSPLLTCNVPDTNKVTLSHNTEEYRQASKESRRYCKEVERGAETEPNSDDFCSSKHESVHKKASSPPSYQAKGPRVANDAKSEEEKIYYRQKKESPIPSKYKASGGSVNNYIGLKDIVASNERLRKEIALITSDSKRSGSRPNFIYENDNMSKSQNESLKFSVDKATNNKKAEKVDSTTPCDTGDKQPQKRSKSKKTFTRRKCKSPLFINDDSVEKCGKKERTVSSTDKFNDKYCASNYSPSTASSNSPLLDPISRVPTSEVHPDGEISNKYEKKEALEKSMSKRTDCNDSYFREEGMAFGDTTTVSPIILTASVKQDATVDAPRKKKDDAAKVLPKTNTTFEDTSSDPEMYLKCPPSPPMTTKVEETKTKHQKQSKSDTKGKNDASTVRQDKPRPANDESCISTECDTNNRLKYLYRRPEVDEQVYQNADNVFREMKSVLMAKGKWYGK